jgi:hypothetical protein
MEEGEWVSNRSQGARQRSPSPTKVLALQSRPTCRMPMTSARGWIRQLNNPGHPRSSSIVQQRTAMNEWPPPGRTILDTAKGGPRLVIENVKSFEWESFDRRSKPARERLGPLRPFIDLRLDADSGPRIKKKSELRRHSASLHSYLLLPWPVQHRAVRCHCKNSGGFYACRPRLVGIRCNTIVRYACSWAGHSRCFENNL